MRADRFVKAFYRACAFVLLFLPVAGRAATSDTTQINTYLSAVWPLHFHDLDSALKLSNYCYEQAQLAHNEKLLMRSLHMLGVIQQESGDYRNSITNLEAAITLAKKLQDQKRLGHLYNSVGMSYHLAGNYRLGMQYVLNSAKIKEEVGDTAGTITTYINISTLYQEQGDTANALRYAQSAFDFCYKNKVADYYPEVNAAMGRVLLVKGDTAAAKIYLVKSLDFANETNKPLKALPPLHDLSQLALGAKDTALAHRYILEFERVVTSTNDKTHLSALYYAYAQYYLLKGKPWPSEKYSRIAIGLAENKDKPQLVADMYAVYARALKVQGKNADAIMVLERLSRLKDSINAIDKAEATRRISAEFENQEQDNEIRALNEEKKKNEDELRWKNSLILLIVAGLIVILAFLFFVFFVYRRNRKTMELLQLKNREIGIKNNIITSRNRDISDSIHYARHIQDALLPDAKEKELLFPNSFILYKPKDVLSGDFYWLAHARGKKIIAAADCTGHGIPGALLSIACNSFLNEIIHLGVTDPAEILSELRFMVIRSLKQTGAHGETRDGLDIAVLCFDEQTHTVEYAGARNPLCIVRNGQTTIEKIDGDRRAVGYHLGKGLPFAKHRVSYSPGDVFYIFTDGYADQFGGGENKKYRRQMLLNLLESISHLGMKEQEQALLKAHEKWKEDEEQTDDILVIGVRAE